ncbi:MAG: sialate O-acetylesterase [Planctomycetaceae bacterium]
MPRHLPLLLTVLLSIPASTAAALQLPAMFSDAMVLQRDRPTRIWGWATAGAKVDVVLGDHQRFTTANDAGRWELSMPELPAGGPHALTVSGDGSTTTIKDILVGDVWLCSGQSNMAMTVSRCNNAQAEADAAKYPQIRMFQVSSAHATEPQDTCRGTWVVCSPETVSGFSATAYFFGRRLHRELNIPIGLINSSVGGTSIESWTSMDAQSAVPAIKPRLEAWQQDDAAYDADQAQARYEKALDVWTKNAAAAKAAGKPVGRKPQLAGQPRNDRNFPANLFNGKIHPLVGYTLKGAIWYQGENSSGRGFAHLYGDQLSTLIKDWRDRWGQGDFPFGWVQLPNYRTPQTQPAESSGWVLVQDGMRRTLQIPHTGMAVTIDVGDARDIHPKDKQTVGHRMAQWALADVYGQDIPAMGPIYRTSTVKGNTVIIEFDHADGLHANSDLVKGFAISGPDRKFVNATAKIVGNTVHVSSDDVPEPVSVRYAWAANPVFSLYNSAKIPASPFRTDDWDETGQQG